MPGLATGATKRIYISELGSQNGSKIELKGILKSMLKREAQKGSLKGENEGAEPQSDRAGSVQT